MQSEHVQPGGKPESPQEELSEYQQGEGTSGSLKERRRKAEIDEILRALDKYGWDTKGKKTAAASLGIGIATLYRILKDYQK